MVVQKGYVFAPIKCVEKYRVSWGLQVYINCPCSLHSGATGARQCRHNGNRIPVGRHHVIPTSLPRCLPKSGVPRGRVPILDVMV